MHNPVLMSRRHSRQTLLGDAEKLSRRQGPAQFLAQRLPLHIFHHQK